MAAAKSAASKATKAVAAAAAAAPKPEKAVKAAIKPATKRKPGGGLYVTLPVSAAFKKFFGVSEMSRVDASRQVWAYIKSNQLQDPEQRRTIVCDEKLRSFLNCEQRIDMTKLPGLLSPHFLKKST